MSNLLEFLVVNMVMEVYLWFPEIENFLLVIQLLFHFDKCP